MPEITCYACKKKFFEQVDKVKKSMYFSVNSKGEKVISSWWKQRYCSEKKPQQFMGGEECGNCSHIYGVHQYREKAKVFGNGENNCNRCGCAFFYPKSEVKTVRIKK